MFRLPAGGSICRFTKSHHEFLDHQYAIGWVAEECEAYHFTVNLWQGMTGHDELYRFLGIPPDFMMLGH